jgi:hypothetical protein
MVLGAMVLAALLILTRGSALAQDKKAADKPAAAQAGKPDPAMEAWMKASIPGPQHQLLDALAGSWSGVVKMWMDPTKPPTESACTIDSKWILGGRFLHEEVKGQFMGQPFSGVGLTGYDNIQKKYVGMWVDSMSTGISHSQGTADAAGKTFTFEAENLDPLSGKKVKSRDVTRIQGKDNYSLEMFKTGPDGKEFKAMEIVFTRQPKSNGK